MNKSATSFDVIFWATLILVHVAKPENVWLWGIVMLIAAVGKAVEHYIDWKKL